MLHHYVEGSGPPIVFLHGMAGSARYWDAYTRELSQVHTVIRLDLLGFGNSPKKRGCEYTMQDHLDAIAETLDSLDITTFTLVGHSMGAIIATRFATRFSTRVTRLILLGLPLYETSEQAKSILVHNQTVPRVMLEGPIAHLTCRLFCTSLAPLTRQALPYIYRNTPSQVAKDGIKHTWISYSRTYRHVMKEQNTIANLRDLITPTTLLIGTDDWAYRQMNYAQAVPSNVELVVIDGAGHNFPLTRPDHVLGLFLPQ